ncbi:unnamed protein product [marine sediment metagenome]|uniref:Uncharacterized protein n=1 Tax=marine sediment metagenome TaxID=412755 RepID=X1D5T2_9ZZZZ
MSCKCPLCDKETTSVGTLFLHLINIHDDRHERWLESYCSENNINFGELLANRVKGVKNANKPLTDILRRDYCK